MATMMSNNETYRGNLLFSTFPSLIKGGEFDGERRKPLTFFAGYPAEKDEEKI